MSVNVSSLIHSRFGMLQRANEPLAL